jgi:Fe-S cluster assembly iron-binding protein IscA
MIEISDAVKFKILEILEKNPGKILRLAVEGDGCAGPYLGLSLDEPGTNELTTRINGIEILVSDAVKRYAEVTTIKISINEIEENLL